MILRVLIPLQPSCLATALGAVLALASGMRAEPVLIEHIWGTTHVAEVPQRIVSLSYNGADNWLALGVVPHAYRVWYGGDDTGLWPWAASAVGERRPVQLRGEIDTEAIARLEPDLIEAMYSGLTRAEYRALSRVAPVIGPPPGRGDFAATWSDMVDTFGKVLRREPDAHALISAVEGRFSEIRATHPEWSAATAVVAMADGPLILTLEDGRMQVLAQMGFAPHPPAEALGYGSFFYRMDAEMTEPLESDVVLWLDLGGGVEVVKGNPLRPLLRSVAEGREVVVEPVLSAALSYASALSLPYVLDHLPALLEAAVDGDPATRVPTAVAAGLAP